MEIGLQSAAQNFDKIQCEYKVSVDPDPSAHATFCMTSDDFFERLKPGNQDYIFDLIFIDGLHTAEQVQKDFENAIKILSSNGYIVIHDANPQKEEHTIVPRPTPSGHWNGSCYKFAVQLASNWANYKTVDIDNGCGVFYNCFEKFSLQAEPKDWNHFNRNRKELLNLITWDEFVSL